MDFCGRQKEWTQRGLDEKKTHSNNSNTLVFERQREARVAHVHVS